MVKYLGFLTAGLVAGGALAGSATVASANHYYGHGCSACGAPTTSRVYRTVHPMSSVTRYRDANVYHRQPRIHNVVTITRVQPIVRIHDVTRVHHHTIFYTQNAYSSYTQQLAPIQYVTHSVVNTYSCPCGY